MNNFFIFIAGVVFFVWPSICQSANIEFFFSEIVIPFEVEAPNQIELPTGIEVPKTMTKEEIDDLLGLDPYLGPTSWLATSTEES